MTFKLKEKLKGCFHISKIPKKVLYNFQMRVFIPQKNTKIQWPRVCCLTQVCSEPSTACVWKTSRVCASACLNRVCVWFMLATACVLADHSLTYRECATARVLLKAQPRVCFYVGPWCMACMAPLLRALCSHLWPKLFHDSF